MAEHKDIAVFEPRPGQTMGEYVVIPPSLRDHPAQFGTLLKHSTKYVSSIPSKPKRKKASG